MNFDQLQHKHRSIIVHRANRLYGIKSASVLQQKAIDEFLIDGDLQALLAALKSQDFLPANSQPVPEIVPVQEGTGTITVYDSDLTFCVGEERQIKVEIKNLSGTTWQTNEHTPVFLSYHWYTENGDICDYDGRRTPLPTAILSGETQHLNVNIQPFNGIGIYLLEVTMVMECKFWFEQCGLNTRRETVKIAPPKLLPYVDRIYKDLMAAIKRRKQEIV
jgi:hypothetical protein